MMRIEIITLFPEMCEAVLAESILGRARKKGFLQICCRQLRDYTYDKHNRVDDCVFGGGKGMLLLAEPIAACLDDVISLFPKKPRVIYLSPLGQVMTQSRVCELAKAENLILLCGHYEGVDERVLETYVDETISLGDFVLTGGELPALALTDAVCRMVKGVLAEDICFEEESHYQGLLEYPQYTRPAVWREKKVPEVLLTGHHAKIEDWRRAQSLWRTKTLRPDLFSQYQMTPREEKLLFELQQAQKIEEN